MHNKKMSENGLLVRGLLWRSFVELHWKKVVAVGCSLVIASAAQMLGQTDVVQALAVGPVMAWFFGLLGLLLWASGAVIVLAGLYLSWRVVTVNIEIMRIRRFFPLEYKWLNAAGIKTYQDCILFLWVIGQPRLDLSARGRTRVFISRDEYWVSPLLRLFHDFPYETYSWQYNDLRLSVDSMKCPGCKGGGFSATAVVFCTQWAKEHKTWRRMEADFWDIVSSGT